MQTAEARKTVTDPADIAAELLGRPVDRCLRAAGGGNSRVYRVESGNETYALKMYPSLSADPRDRQGVEKQALEFFAQGNIACVPRWLNACPGYALLSWVEGTLAIPPSDEELEKAIAFIAGIRNLSQLPNARALPPASEACTSGAEIVRQIEARLARLHDAAKANAALHHFLGTTFLHAFNEARLAALSAPIAFDTPLTSGLCLIPADFGFHNTLRGPDGALTFIDFEYFGWDDPVKLTADFLLHPATSLSLAQRARLHEAMLSLFRDDEGFAARLAALTPLFALRWSLILLNEFLPERWSGRAFAQRQSEWAEVKTRQLAKAETMLKNKDMLNA